MVDDVSAQMCLLRFCLKDNRIDGRFFDSAQNDGKADSRTRRFPRSAEEAPRLTKHLLRHRMM